MGTVAKNLKIESTPSKTIYTVEIFESDFTYRSSMQTSDLSIELDYLDVSKNKIKIKTIKAYEGDYIRISTADIELDGIVTGVSDDGEYAKISFKSFMDIFDIEIFADVTDLESVTMESFIASLIDENYISNADSLQNIYGLETKVLTGTLNTSLTVDSDIINFYKDIVYSAFLQYNIVVDFSIETRKKKVVCTIKKNIQENLTIEADLPNIIKKNIDLSVSKESYNKLIVINEDDDTEQEIYYLHSDNTIDLVNNDRVTPVNFTTDYAVATTSKTFTEVAYDKAVSLLKQNEYNNLIELEMSNNDTLIKPMSLEVGRNTTVISDGVSYQTILTGVKVEKTTTLIFGAIRRELTKRIKWRI